MDTSPELTLSQLYLEGPETADEHDGRPEVLDQAVDDEEEGVGGGEGGQVPATVVVHNNLLGANPLQNCYRRKSE